MPAIPELLSRIVVSNTQVNAIIPLAILQAVRFIDSQGPAGLEEFREELKSKRLGSNPTVAAQIERYSRLAAANASVEEGEVVQLLRLVGRRSDAGLVFSHGGRWAARQAFDRASPTLRIMRRMLGPLAKRRVGLAVATRLAERFFAAELFRDEAHGIVAVATPPSADATPGGEACAFYGAAFAELLRGNTDFDGVMLHSSCRARGDDSCRWHTGSNQW